MIMTTEDICKVQQLFLLWISIGPLQTISK